MTMFDERDKAFENKFAHDQELMFKLTARVHRQVGQWAATEMGKTGIEAENYAVDLVQGEMSSDVNKLIQRLQKDFTAAKVTVSAEQIQAVIERETEAAKAHLLGK